MAPSNGYRAENVATQSDHSPLEVISRSQYPTSRTCQVKRLRYELDSLVLVEIEMPCPRRADRIGHISATTRINP
jgi:hypothetical protein